MNHKIRKIEIFNFSYVKGEDKLEQFPILAYEFQTDGTYLDALFKILSGDYKCSPEGKVRDFFDAPLEALKDTYSANEEDPIFKPLGYFLSLSKDLKISIKDPKTLPLGKLITVENWEDLILFETLIETMDDFIWWEKPVRFKTNWGYTLNFPSR